MAIMIDNVPKYYGESLDELYIPKHTEKAFKEILYSNLKPIYESARIQGYKIWEGPERSHRK